MAMEVKAHQKSLTTNHNVMFSSFKIHSSYLNNIKKHVRIITRILTYNLVLS